MSIEMERYKYVYIFELSQNNVIITLEMKVKMKSILYESLHGFVQCIVKDHHLQVKCTEPNVIIVNV